MTATRLVATKSVRTCYVCKARLKIHEGELCSCSLMLCMRHRYKADHSCRDGKAVASMEKIEPKKIDKI